MCADSEGLSGWEARGVKGRWRGGQGDGMQARRSEGEVHQRVRSLRSEYRASNKTKALPPSLWTKPRPCGMSV